MIGYRISLLIWLLFLFFMVKAQPLAQLKENKEKTRIEIEYTNQLLNQTGENSKVSLNKLSLLSEQINLRNNLIIDFNSQLNLLQKSINDNEFVIKMLTDDLNKIRSDYANLIQQAYRKRGDYNQLFFLMASESFNQAYKRLLYTRQMTRYREKQAEQIEAIRTVLMQKTTELNGQKKEKKEVLMLQMKETSKLNVEKEKQSNFYQQLQKRQRELKQHLKYQQKVEERLQKEIEKLIAEEAEKARLIAKTPEDLLLSENFEKNKGRFPWPTIQGVITDKFGEHPHPVMKNIIIRNNGVDITTNPGEKARAIFNGTVSKVFAIPGGNTAVIIRHGEYISVYSNLKEVYVRQGEKVEIKQELGAIYIDTAEDNKTILKFQLWKESIKLNPELWISK